MSGYWLYSTAVYCHKVLARRKVDIIRLGNLHSVPYWQESGIEQIYMRFQSGQPLLIHDH